MKRLASLSFLLMMTCLGALLPLRHVEAQQETAWQGPVGSVGDWFEAENWTAGVPLGDYYQNLAVIDNGAAARIGAGMAEAGQLHLGRTSSGELSLDGGRLDVLYNVVLGQEPDAHGRLSLNGGVFAAQSLLAGHNGGQGMVNQIGGLLEAEFLRLGSSWYYFSSPQGEPEDYGQGEYRLLGGRLELNQAAIGASGIGDFRQEGGVAAIESRLTVGGKVGSSPTVSEEPIVWYPPALSSVPRLFPINYNVVIPAPVPSRGRYELLGGSLTTRELRIDNTGEVRQSGGSLAAEYIELSGEAGYLYDGGSLVVESGLHANGGFDFAGSSATLRAGAAILNFAAGLPHAENAKIEVGADSLTILPAGFDHEAELGAFTSQGLVHFAGSDLTIPVNRTVRGWGRIDDHAKVGGAILAADDQAAINLNGLELLAGGEVDLGAGSLNVPNDRTAIRGGSLAAESIDVSGTVTYLPPIVTTGPNGTHIQFQLPAVTPGLARQTSGSVNVDDLSITNGAYEISGGTLHAQQINVGKGPFIISPLAFSEPLRRFTQSGGTVVVGTLQLSPQWVYLQLDAPVPRTDAVGLSDFPLEDLEDYDGLLPRLDAYATGRSVYELDGGVLQAERIYVSQDFFARPAAFTQSGGNLIVSQSLRIAGAEAKFSISGGSLHTRRLHLGGPLFGLPRPDATLAILDKDADITVAGELLLGSETNFVAVPGTEIHLTRPAPPGQYEFQPPTANSVAIHSTDADAMSGLSNLTLVFEGGADLASTIEAAGADRGPSLAGFYQNFALETLVLGGVEPASLSLVDLVQNDASEALPEALYVEHLIINAGSTLDLNGIKLYYRTADVSSFEALALGSFGTQVIPEPSTALLLVAAAWVFRRHSR